MTFSRLSVAFVALLYAPAIAAQSHPGVTFDQSIRSVRTHSGTVDTGMAVMHVTAGGTNLKLEISGNVAGMKGVPAGKHFVMMFVDGGARMTFFLPDDKQYMTFNPIQMIEGVQKMMAGMGATMTVDTAVTKVKLDSVGPGPDIDGHHTLHYRLASRLRMTISMMGNSGVLDQESTEEIDSATDYDDLRGIGQSMERMSELSEAMGVAKDYLDRIAAARSKLRGFPLRIVKQEIKKADGMTETSNDLMEVSNIRRIAVPDSAFAIPADYKPIAFPMFPGAVADTTTTR